MHCIKPTLCHPLLFLSSLCLPRSPAGKETLEAGCGFCSVFFFARKKRVRRHFHCCICFCYCVPFSFWIFYCIFFFIWLLTFIRYQSLHFDHLFRWRRSLQWNCSVLLLQTVIPVCQERQRERERERAHAGNLRIKRISGGERPRESASQLEDRNF